MTRQIVSFSIIFSYSSVSITPVQKGSLIKHVDLKFIIIMFIYDLKFVEYFCNN
jgi:hypothetical protein